MVYIMAGLLVLAGVLIGVLFAEIEHSRQQVTTLLRHAEAERSRLLDRIQHPTVRQVKVSTYVDPPPLPRDASETAHVGGFVPEFVTVGTPPGEDPMDWVGMEIPEDVEVVGMNADG